MADDEAFAEECRRRGQNALPFQPANARSPKALLKPAAYSKHAFHCNSDEDDDLVMTSWESPFYSSGVRRRGKEGPGSPKPRSQSPARVRCCVLT